MTLYFITGNKKKFDEVKEIIPEIKHLKMDLTEMQEIDAHKIIKEKLKEAVKNYSGEIVIEDTSLYLKCLNGLPGPLIKWFLESMGNRGLFELCVKYGNFDAEAKTIVGYFDNAKINFFEGVVKGRIVEPGGDGFGWDCIFVPEGNSNRFNELSKEEKNKISMRGIAFQKLKDFISQKN